MINHGNYVFVLPLRSFPLLCSISFFNIGLGIFFFVKFNFFYLLICLVSSIFSSFIWWIRFSLDLSEIGNRSFCLSYGLKLSFLMFILSEVFFFFSFFWSYFHFFLPPLVDFNFRWPPYSVLIFDFIDIPMLNTFILLISGLRVTISHIFFLEGGLLKSLIFLGFTSILGFLFSYFQLLEYFESFFSWNDGCFGCSFFLLTGFHGLHVVVGRLFLSFCLIRVIFRRRLFNTVPLSFELSSWYWHFVDVIWIFLYFFLYVYSRF